jgi:hypothetical protein
MEKSTIFVFTHRRQYGRLIAATGVALLVGTILHYAADVAWLTSVAVAIASWLITNFLWQAVWLWNLKRRLARSEDQDSN